MVIRGPATLRTINSGSPSWKGGPRTAPRAADDRSAARLGGGVLKSRRCSQGRARTYCSIDAGRPGGADSRARRGPGREVPAGGPRGGSGVHGGGDRARGEQHERHLPTSPPRAGLRRADVGHDGAAHAGAGRPGHPWTRSPRGRAKVRARVWWLIAAPPAGFVWLVVAGKILKGWLVIDLDATLITAEDAYGVGPARADGEPRKAAWSAASLRL